MRIVLYYSHPVEPQSVVNAPLVEAAKQLGNVKVRWLDELYPSLKMTPEQVAEEQKIVEKADAVFFQFPVYWYSSPPSLKVFMDSVMTYGWAYGSKGVLAGKKFRVICTCGGKMESYGGEFAASDIAKPFNQGFRFCKCDPLPPMVVFSDTITDTLKDDYLKLFK
ncbi:NAD(P)H:menadione oxidoreductase [Giardia duodenalis]|uniref:NAD(P)H:menadione oxidoreductase n=2 Tax=Giardia intestinalis TaxID=5741 RepID=V6TVD3_GIAIN|nr:NADPH oxidoreductase, putative [Giardia intestinalis ATCC 50581]ESU42933.1 NAD(P)H:menadione oxidoreductase [Giardia intestinalis]QBM79353.1 putative NADPH oxidoreductase [Giardia intestinalis]QBM79354.1 putative NADPH oxidoreductase [Giardia intestinalis]QBM79355.1 putative NADPH oxidoreductase [Giardia intestinalis]